jgi:hypothetical protein
MHVSWACVRAARRLNWAGGLRRNLGAGISSLLTDRERLGVAVAGLSVAALGIYSAREGTRVAGRAFDR